MRKTADPHSLSINIDVDKITDAYCSCKAGLGGHCSHIIGLLKTLQYFKLQSFSSIPDRLSCTSMPQAWGAQSARGLRIEPVPINHLTLARNVTHRKRRPKECSVDLNKIVTKVEPEEIAALKLLHGTPLTYMLTPSAPTVSTPLGEVQIGSAVSYQTRNLKADATAVMQQCGNTCVTNNPPVDLPERYKALKDLNICEDPVELEARTREQSKCAEWFEARKKRLTASNFHRVMVRKAKVTHKFLESIFDANSVSAPSLDYGRRNEPLAKSKYLQTHQDRHLHECGFVVSNHFPFIGASPDGKVCDGGRSGLIEIKCPYTARNSTILDACMLPNFCLEMQPSGSAQLKKTYMYYAQVQGQLMITGCDFCDFIVFTHKDLHVERVWPDKVFMSSMLEVLAAFYQDHAVPYLQNL
ncbi:uncharacterized protein LOC118558687 [Fundulus heteroclitus]|uniref:uncharacterized protein LOC118558687 n=1 Tax=Fundulus heteroclitus TaxID=8078 RepID=UPI00165B85E5|nr:uncharacterized protein LOC118558687 [Fundulus heteroclitus]